jgi:hypothetical protein
VIEQRIADRFRTAVLDEPPLGFDPDEVVDRAKRRQRHRRAIGASALATIGVALAAVAVFAASGGTQLGGVGTPGSSESVTPTTPPPRPTRPVEKEGVAPSTPPQTFPGSDAAVAHLSQAIPAVLAEKVTGLKFTKPDGDTLMVDAARRGIGGAYLATGTKHRYVSVFVSHNKNTLDLAGDPAAAGGWGSRTKDETQGDNSQLRVYTMEDTDGTAAVTVVHLRTDGVIVIASTTAKPEPGRTGLAVSMDVLAAIATDGRLTF